uniref:Uncharacterized protein n=1 Tax=Ixodes ricinus TaxID=34613 RepID=A0A6B0ULT3_IXORI
MPLNQCSFFLFIFFASQDQLSAVSFFMLSQMLGPVFLTIISILESFRPYSAVIVCSGGSAGYFTLSPSLCGHRGGSLAKLSDNQTWVADCPAWRQGRVSQTHIAHAALIRLIKGAA